MFSPCIRRVSVLGCGLIGASVALALRRAGVHVALSDRDPRAVAKAERMGAGTAAAPGDPPADLVVIATPPSTVAGVLRDAQARGLGAVYTDVASTKAAIVAEAGAAGCDLTTYVPGHPMAGGELSGPGAARADLFTGRRWALCPLPVTSPHAVRVAAELVALCGAELRTVRPDDHDRSAAAVSHAPHLVAAALAARFADAGEVALALAGPGLRDVTRIAGGDPGLWCDIVRQNAGAVAEVLDAVVRDLAEVASALRGPDRPAPGALAGLLARGNRGRELIVATGSVSRADPTGRADSAGRADGGAAGERIAA